VTRSRFHIFLTIVSVDKNMSTYYDDEKATVVTGDIYDLKEYTSTRTATAPQAETVYSVLEDFKQAKPAFSLDKKPVLEDLPVAGIPTNTDEDLFSGGLDTFFEKTKDILSQFQEAANKELDVAVKLEDLKLALEKVIVKSQTRKLGSSLVTKFLQASKTNDFQTISNIFESFGNQAERFARVIVSERSEPVGARLITQSFIGGVAGGKKFIAR
jgi:hypothetical protein